MNYIIKNLTIEVPEMEDTKRWLKQICDSQIASGVYQDNNSFLSNLTDILQSGFGIYLGFNDNEVVEENEIE